MSYKTVPQQNKSSILQERHHRSDAWKQNYVNYNCQLLSQFTDPEVLVAYITVSTLRKTLLYSTYSCTVPLSIRHDKVHKPRKIISPVIVSIPNLVRIIVLQSTVMFFVDRVVNLYVLGTTRTAATYMFPKEELAEESFTTEKKQKYRTLQIAILTIKRCNLYNKVQLANIACMEEHGKTT